MAEESQTPEDGFYVSCVYFDKSKKTFSRGSWVVEYWQNGEMLALGWRREENITANSCALVGIAVMLEALEEKGLLPEKFEFHTCFQYVARGLHEWLDYWLENDFIGRSTGKPVKNRQLWERLAVFRKRAKIRWYRKGGCDTITRLANFCWYHYNHQEEDLLPQGVHWNADSEMLARARERAGEEEQKNAPPVDILKGEA